MLRLIKILIACGVLAGCAANNNMAPVHDHSRQVSNRVGYHVVSKGETLFAIAFRYGLNYKTLAAYNRINPPYTIYPGQKLYLNAAGGASPVTSVAPAPASSGASVAVATPVAPSAPLRAGAPYSSPSSSSRSKTPTPAANPVAAAPAGISSSGWQWPLRGTIITTYAASQGLSKGIDIAGRLGESVLAAGSGTVVYSGSGLRGYGNLLIIKHNETFLSAYGHNDKLLVKEGETVKAGQKIAEVGSSGTDKVMLHFEIRRNGAPVDPMQYLPR